MFTKDFPKENTLSIFDDFWRFPGRFLRVIRVFLTTPHGFSEIFFRIFIVSFDFLECFERLSRVSNDFWWICGFSKDFRQRLLFRFPSGFLWISAPRTSPIWKIHFVFVLIASWFDYIGWWQPQPDTANSKCEKCISAAC